MLLMNLLVQILFISGKVRSDGQFHTFQNLFTACLHTNRYKPCSSVGGQAKQHNVCISDVIYQNLYSSILRANQRAKCYETVLRNSWKCLHNEHYANKVVGSLIYTTLGVQGQSVLPQKRKFWSQKTLVKFWMAIKNFAHQSFCRPYFYCR